MLNNLEGSQRQFYLKPLSGAADSMPRKQQEIIYTQGNIINVQQEVIDDLITQADSKDREIAKLNAQIGGIPFMLQKELHRLRIQEIKAAASARLQQRAFDKAEREKNSLGAKAGRAIQPFFTAVGSMLVKVIELSGRSSKYDASSYY